MKNKQPNPFPPELFPPGAIQYLAKHGVSPDSPTEKFCSALPFGIFRREKGVKSTTPTFVPMCELSTTQLAFLITNTFHIPPLLKAVMLEIIKERARNGEESDEMEDGVDSLFPNCQDDDCDSCQGRV